ncbi:MAG: ANTAR domain-containing protein [Rhodospirillales bacterium]
MNGADLTILIIDENRDRAAILEAGLRESGYLNISLLETLNNVLGRVRTINPDVIIIDIEKPTGEALEIVLQIPREAKRAVAMFMDSNDPDVINAAVAAGVGALVVNGLAKDRVKHVVDIAISRFKAFHELHNRLQEAETALAERKIIEQAKGILMSQRSLTEGDAYALLRKTAMNEKKRIVEIARSIITASKLI